MFTFRESVLVFSIFKHCCDWTYVNIFLIFFSQALESTKGILNEDFLGSIEAYLAKEVKILQQQWITVECQEKFKQHAVKG